MDDPEMAGRIEDRLTRIEEKLDDLTRLVKEMLQHVGGAIRPTESLSDRLGERRASDAGDLANIWRQCLGEVERQLPKSAIENFLRMTRLVGTTEGTATVAVPGGHFALSRVESRFGVLLRQAFYKVTGMRVEMLFVPAETVPDAVAST